MNKVNIFLLLIMTSLLLSGCVQKNNFDYETLSSNVNEIKIIHVVQEWDILEYEEISNIDSTEINDFLIELSNLDFKKSLFGDRGELDDETCIMLVYSNGDFDIISRLLVVSFNSENEQIAWDVYLFDDYEGFDDLIEDYS